MENVITIIKIVFVCKHLNELTGFLNSVYIMDVIFMGVV